MESERILVVDDEAQIRRFLTIGLSSQGYEVFCASSGQEGLELSKDVRPHLVILDLGLPDLDGKTVLRELVIRQSVPVLVLSVRSGEQDKVAALDLGAEDYVVKPFNVNELLARIRRIFRQQSSATGPNWVYDDGKLFVDPAEKTLKLDGRPVSLTRKEWAVFSILVRQPGRLVTQTALLKSAWGQAHEPDSQYVRNIIRLLRIKLDDSPAHPVYLETEPGVGYRFLDNRR